MKKILWMVGVMVLLTGSVFAQHMRFSSDKYKAVYQKVFRMDRLTPAEIPNDYNYKENQDSKNLFYGAKEIAATNPKSFNAAWNYALLTESISNGEELTDQMIDEAYKLYEKAKQLRPGDVKVYTRQIELVYTRLWGVYGESFYFHDGKMYGDTEIIATYQHNPDQARKMLGLIEREISLSGIDPNMGTTDDTLYAHIQHAYYICKALNRTDEAAKWEKLKQSSKLYKARKMKVAINAFREAKAAAVQAQKAAHK